MYGAYSARREGERHFYHALTSLIAANKRDYLPDASFYRGTESGRLQTRNQTSTSGERPSFSSLAFLLRNDIVTDSMSCDYRAMGCASC
eukprot:scaffold25239_cov67-Phaeocystis_antarctica.AAC.1